MALPELRHVFFAGEPLAGELIERWRKLLPGRAEIVNLYGPTETTLAKCAYKIPSQSDVRPGIQPIGCAIPGAQALVLRKTGVQRCGVGELGEIVLRTPFRTLGLADARQQIFVPNPYCDDAADLLYRTGDLGRVDEDGVLEIHGRVDQQVKVNGIRIEPQEVAAALERHPRVRAAAVIPVSDRGAIELAAFVVANGELSAFELRDHAGLHLMAAMVPARFCFVDRLPFTLNGKLDIP